MNARRFITAVVALVFIVSELVLTQTKNVEEPPISPVRLTLALTGNVQKTSVPANAIFGPIWCNADDAVYARLPNSSGDVLKWPLTRITAKTSTLFDFTQVPGTDPQASLQAYAAAVDVSGRVYYVIRQLSKDSASQFLFTFSSEGAFQSKAPIDSNLTVFTLLPLPGDHFLMAGFSRPPESDPSKRARSTFIGIYDSDGRLTRDLTSSEDNQAIEAVGQPPHPYNSAIQRGGVRLGRDGNIYFLKGSLPPRIQVLSANGDPEREIRLWQPFEGAVPVDLIVSAGEFLVKYYDPDVKKAKRELVWVAYSMTDAQPKTVYDIRQLKGQVACYSDDGFVVLALTPDRFFGFAKAEVQ